MILFFKKLKEFFVFSKSDRKGVITLSILIIVILTGHCLIKFAAFSYPADHSEFESAMDAWHSRVDSNSKINLFWFDPNTISAGQLDSLSLPFSIKRNLIKYRKSGGRFYKAADLRKIFGMNDSIYEAVKEYIVIEKVSDSLAGMKHLAVVEEVASYSHSRKRKDNIFITELNSADSAQLVRLKGIGPVFASRIIKYRNLLGGFYSDCQLLEIYNFPEETFIEIRRYINVDTTVIKKIRINYADFSDLLRHPYLEKADVEKIVRHREKFGPFDSVEQVLGLCPADSVKKNGLRHYLTCR